MDQKVSRMNNYKLVARALFNLTCHTCEEDLRKDIKERGLRSIGDNPKAVFLVPFYWLHRVCPHHQDYFLKSPFAEISNGEAARQAGVEATSRS